MNRFLTFIVVLVCLAAVFFFYVTGPFGAGLESLPPWLGGTQPSGGGDKTSAANPPTYNLTGTGRQEIRVNSGAATRICYTAPQSGTYRFTTIGSADTVGTLYLSATASNYVVRRDDGNGRAFRIDYQLTAGQTVYLDVSYSSSSESGTETLSITRLIQMTTTSTPRATATPRPATTNTPRPQNVSTGYSTVSIRAGQTVRLRFVAPSSGTYVFTTTGNQDTVGMLYGSASGSSTLAQNDDSDGSRNFCITRSLSANETVWLGVRFFSSSESGQVQVRIYRQTSTGSASNNTSGSTSGRPANWPVGEVVRVYVSSGNTRTGPGVNYSWSGYVNRGYTFEVVERRLGDTGKDWYRIWHEGKYQWISSGLVEIDGYRNGTVNGVPIPND